jgi:hypothetical protein
MKKTNVAAAIILTSALLPICAEAQNVLISPTVNNGSFEYTGSGAGTFDAISGNQKAGFNVTDDNTPYGPVPNWAVWNAAVGGPSTADNDSGVQGIPGDASDGQNIAYLQGGNAEYNLTSFVIQAGDVFTYSWDWVLQGRGTATAQLAYWNGSAIVAIAGTSTSAQSNSGKVLDVTTTWTVPAGDPSIGDDIALTIAAPSGSNYPEVDNFNLSASSVPEPSITALGGLGILALLALKRKCFAC